MATNQFYPRVAYINAITNATQAVVTFTEAHDYRIGEIVSFRVTKEFGMFQMNQKRSRVLATASTTITTEIDTLTWDAFNYASLDGAGTTPPVCVPVGSGILKGENPSTNFNDAFDNRRV